MGWDGMLGEDRKRNSNRRRSVGATGVEININLISTERRYTGIVLFAAISFALKLSPRVPATPSTSDKHVLQSRDPRPRTNWTNNRGKGRRKGRKKKEERNWSRLGYRGSNKRGGVRRVDTRDGNWVGCVDTRGGMFFKQGARKI